MTSTERRALAAALRHGREHYAFRPGWWGSVRSYRWYPKPYTGWMVPVLEVTHLTGGQWLLEFGINRVSVDSVGVALSVLAFFGVYQPAPKEEMSDRAADAILDLIQADAELRGYKAVTP